MFKITVFRALFCVFVMLYVAGCQSEDVWKGSYLYEDELGVNAPGTPMIVDYQLTVGASVCLLDINGYQTEEHILCSSSISSNRLDVQFQSYSDGGMTNIFGVERFGVGEVLFRFEKNGKVLRTTWEGLKPDGVQEKTDVYFSRLVNSGR